VPEMGMIPSPVDQRDYQYAHYGEMYSTDELPDEYLPEYLPPVEDQGAVASCVAFSSMMVRELQEQDELGYPVRLSRNFAYHYRPSAYFWQGKGVVPREHLNTLRRYGAPPEIYWPGNDERGSETEPNPFEEVLRAALPHRIGSYTAVDPRFIPEAKSAVYSRSGILLGVPIHTNFRPDSDGVIPYPSGNLVGYHMMPSLAYLRSLWVVPNSWGQGWGPGVNLPDGRHLPGYCYIPWSYPIVECWTTVDQPTVQETRLIVIEGDPVMYRDGQPLPAVDLAPYLADVPGGHRFVASMRHIIEALGGEIVAWGKYLPDHPKWPAKMWFDAKLVNKPWPRT